MIIFKKNAENKMNDLELLTFKNIFNNLSVKTQESFIKEIKYEIYNDIVNEAIKHEIFSSLDIDTRNAILNLIKKNNEILLAITNDAMQQICKYGLVYKILNELILTKNAKIRLFNYINSDKEFYICISPSDLINSINEHDINWIDDWKPYSMILLSTLNIPTARWKLQENGEMKLISELIGLKIFDDL